MNIAFPKNELFEKHIEELYLYRKTSCSQDFVEYQGIFEIRVNRGWLKLNPKNFALFYRNIRVAGGTKRKSKDVLVITPLRDKKATIRLPVRIFELLSQVAEKHKTRPSSYARDLLTVRVCTTLKALGWPERDIKPVFMYSPLPDDEVIGDKRLTIRLSRDEFDVLSRLARDKPLSKYVRETLEHELIEEGLECGVLTPMQTSEKHGPRQLTPPF